MAVEMQSFLVDPDSSTTVAVLSLLSIITPSIAVTPSVPRPSSPPCPDSLLNADSPKWQWMPSPTIGEQHVENPCRHDYADQMEAASVESLPKPSNCSVEYRITENVLPSSIHGELAWLGSRDVSPLKHWNNANS